MTKEYLTQLAEVSSRIRAMRSKLPDVNSGDLAVLNQQLAQINLSGVQENEVAQIQDAFVLLAREINMTMERLNQHCDDMRTNLDSIEQHSTGVKAYVVTQNTK